MGVPLSGEKYGSREALLAPSLALLFAPAFLSSDQTERPEASAATPLTVT